MTNTVFHITILAFGLFFVFFSFLKAKVEDAEFSNALKINSIRKAESNLQVSMLRVKECLNKIKEFKAKGYTSTVDYYRKELQEQRAWMNYHRACLASLKAA